MNTEHIILLVKVCVVVMSFAKEISKQINSHVMITPVSTKEMADEVVRPSYVVLDNFIYVLVSLVSNANLARVVTRIYKRNQGGLGWH